MDYSLLLGIHDVERAEREEEEEEEEMESSCGEEEADENSLAPAPGSTSPEGIAGYMNSFKPMGPGDFDPYVDVYAIQSAVGEILGELQWVIWALCCIIHKPHLTQGCGTSDHNFELLLSYVGAPQREVYFMGLIDVLTQYDTKKKAAHAAKAVKHGVRDQCPLHWNDSMACRV